jgi:hypothetical protein
VTAGLLVHVRVVQASRAPKGAAAANITNRDKRSGCGSGCCHDMACWPRQATERTAGTGSRLLPAPGDPVGLRPVRRHRYTGTLSFYPCWTPGPVPLSRLYLAVAAALQRQHHDGNDLNTGLVSITIRELRRFLRVAVIPLPAATAPTGCSGCNGATATSTEPAASPTLEPTPMLRRDHKELQLPYLY